MGKEFEKKSGNPTVDPSAAKEIAPSSAELASPILEKTCLLHQKVAARQDRKRRERKLGGSALGDSALGNSASRQDLSNCPLTPPSSTIIKSSMLGRVRFHEDLPERRQKKSSRLWRQRRKLLGAASRRLQTTLRYLALPSFLILFFANTIDHVSAGGEGDPLAPRVHFDGKIVHNGKTAPPQKAALPQPPETSETREKEIYRPVKALRLSGVATIAESKPVFAHRPVQVLNETSAFSSVFEVVRQSNMHARMGGQTNQDALLLQQASLVFDERGNFRLGLDGPPSAKSLVAGKIVARSHAGDYIFFTLDPKLQAYAEKIIRDTNAPHAALVAMEPETGRILALAQRSQDGRHLLGHAGFPAASLIKVITAATAIEQKKLAPQDFLDFRGGTYTLDKWNYSANAKTDRRRMTLTEALAKSCNPAFARVGALFPPADLERKLYDAGFNQEIPFEWDLVASKATVPVDAYEYARTSAGFGEVRMSPIHAAVLMSGVANNGLLPNPRLVDEVLDEKGKLLYRGHSHALGRFVDADVAHTLRNMMVATTTVGTSKSEFYRNGRPILGSGRAVAGKTGTLSGDNPAGVNNWFFGAAPAHKPEIVIASVVVYSGHVSTRSSRLARQMFQQYFDGR